MLSAVLLFSLAAVPGGGEAETFKAFFSRGEELFAIGEMDAAIANFRRADLLRPTPEVAFDLGKCHEKRGEKAYATYYYRLYLRRAPKAPDALDVAEKVGEALAEAGGDGRGLLEVDSTMRGKATVNGVAYAEFPLAVFLPPGDYELQASFSAGPRKLMVAMHTAKVTSITFEPLPPLLVAPAELAPAPEYAPSAALAEAPVKGRPSLRTPAYVIVGVSAAALVAGTAMGALASSEERRLRSDQANLTVSQARELAASASAKGGAANILWGVGAAGAAAGAVTFVLSLPEPGDAP
jgi:tetratricopeptide (TPR) repeat protein